MIQTIWKSISQSQKILTAKEMMTSGQLFQQTTQHPRIFFMILHALREQVAGWLSCPISPIGNSIFVMRINAC